MKKLKVYGGIGFAGGKQVRVIIATTSWKRAAEASGNSLNYVRNYWSITGNLLEIEIAMNNPKKLMQVARRW